MQPFLEPGRKVQVSPSGGINARWSSDSRRLFYVQFGGQLMEATLVVGADVAVASVNPLFDVPSAATGTLMVDVFPDGNRFVITEPQGMAAARAITVVSNFGQLLRGPGRK